VRESQVADLQVVAVVAAGRQRRVRTSRGIKIENALKARNVTLSVASDFRRFDSDAPRRSI
jgi:hypothetical protein